ncbi:sulfate ABC transporter permease [Burkholderia contaminans]|uniref:Sulfate ABC transporter permease n=1 Tax=Burkholderia contaminans TaxID=488447 RepID=A0A6P3C037_9BURK|nr:sulfate ABC transporter permease [Burkholderia contaminans]
MSQEATVVLKTPSPAARAAKRLDPVSESRVVRWLLTIRARSRPTPCT